MSTFRFQARYALLTYPQCGDLDPFAVVNHLAGLGAECIIGRENHADGGIHLHAFVDFGVKYRTRNARAFDVEGCHPNVSPSRGTPEEGFDYAIKDGDVVAGGLERPTGSRVDADGGVWAEIIDAKDEQEFWDLCKRLAPRALVTSFTQLRAFAAWKFPPIRVPYATPEGVNIDTSWVAELDSWVRENLGRGETGGMLSYTCATSFRGGIPTGGEPLPPLQSRFGALVHSWKLTSIYRTKKITRGIRAFPNGKNHLGEKPGKPRLLRRPL